MGQILVRKVDDDLKARLRERATRNGVSMEEEVRVILNDALRPSLELKFGSRIAELFRDWGVEEHELARLPASDVKPMNFD